jgi:outer membrane lipoprotein-sorting protein
MVLALTQAAPAQTFHPKADPVFRKMLAVNKDLESYTAHIEVKTRIHILGITLRGTVYSKGENTKIDFDNVPGPAKSLVENQPQIGAVSTWASAYAITVTDRNASTTTYHLVPRAEESVDSIEVTVENATGLAQRYVWNNANGSIVTSDETYAPVEGHPLPSAVTTTMRGKGLHADSQTTFSEYQINVPVPDSVFQN